MNENEKAAIAAGLWEPGQMKRVPVRGTQDWQGHQEVLEWGDRPVPAPDMHEPANLWRALEQLVYWGFVVHFDPRFGTVDVDIEGRRLERPNVHGDDLYAALVALYDAEHPNE